MLLLLLKSPEEKVVAIGLADGRTVIHNIEFDETLMTFRQDWGPVTAISFRTGDTHRLYHHDRSKFDLSSTILFLSFRCIQSRC